MLSARMGTLVCAAILLVSGATAVFGDSGGAGGTLYGYTKPDWNPTFMPRILEPTNLYTMGGFGYGVDRDGVIRGGFGFAVLDEGYLNSGVKVSDGFAGGFGGALLGQRIIDVEFLNLDVVLRLGAGGFAYIENEAWRGYSGVYGEAAAELGLVVFPWMRVSAFLGYRAFANLIPGNPFQDLVRYSPTFGATISWGKF
jgi:hypothetical protein